MMIFKFLNFFLRLFGVAVAIGVLGNFRAEHCMVFLAGTVVIAFRNLRTHFSKGKKPQLMAAQCLRAPSDQITTENGRISVVFSCHLS